MPRVTYLFRRVRESLKQGGLGWTARKVMREVIDRFYPPWQCLFWMPLSDLDRAPSDGRVSLRVISELAEDVKLAMLKRGLGASAVSVFQARVKRGCQLCVLFRGETIAGTLFLVLGRAHSFQHHVLTEHDAVILDARIDPEFRGQGLYPILLKLSLGTLKGKEIERVFVATSEHNEPSLRALRRVGFRYLMRYRTWMGIYKYDVCPF
jgi:ribosomal protein S18 acetylase RimI-like enzyme